MTYKNRYGEPSVEPYGTVARINYRGQTETFRAIPDDTWTAEFAAWKAREFADPCPMPVNSPMFRLPA
mgnify:CR=1 FL=1